MSRQEPTANTLHRCLINLSDAEQRITNFNSLHRRFALLNCRSISDKASYLNEIITDNKLDIFLLTETWQAPDDFLQLNLLTPVGYNYLSRPHLHGKGIYRDIL